MVLINGNHDIGNRILVIYGITNIPKLKDFNISIYYYSDTYGLVDLTPGSMISYGLPDSWPVQVVFTQRTRMEGFPLGASHL